MNSESLHIYLRELNYQKGVLLSVEEGELKAEAPPGALTDELRSYLRERRAEIVAVLERREVIKARLAAAQTAAESDPSIDFSLDSEEISSAESHLEDEIVRFIDGEADIDSVSTAWKSLIKLRRAPGDARTRAAV